MPGEMGATPAIKQTAKAKSTMHIAIPSEESNVTHTHRETAKMHEVKVYQSWCKKRDENFDIWNDEDSPVKMK